MSVVMRMAAPDYLTEAEKVALAATVLQARDQAARTGSLRYVVAYNGRYSVTKERPPTGTGHYRVWPGGRMEYRPWREGR